jgi:hypothetical protein
MRIFLSILFLLLPTHSYAEYNDWSDTDKKLYIASQVAIAGDWMTTRYGSRHPIYNTHETNMFLGMHPSVGKVNNYFVGLLVSNYYITDYVDPKYRSLYLAFRITTHGSATIHNINLGWKLAF